MLKTFIFLGCSFLLSSALISQETPQQFLKKMADTHPRIVREKDGVKYLATDIENLGAEHEYALLVQAVGWWSEDCKVLAKEFDLDETELLVYLIGFSRGGLSHASQVLKNPLQISPLRYKTMREGMRAYLTYLPIDDVRTQYPEIFSRVQRIKKMQS